MPLSFFTVYSTPEAVFTSKAELRGWHESFLYFEASFGKKKKKG